VGLNDAKNISLVTIRIVQATFRLKFEASNIVRYNRLKHGAFEVCHFANTRLAIGLDYTRFMSLRLSTNLRIGCL